ncbi:large subunit ribosomal protein L19e [Clonorchis sinensis]|uniref:Large subunit ribosomal protein L19e n=1 Tax=Clonorchis sinensis TaxID=79923 RepID=G7YCV3_CLOSI|nr:large subunit ribosomal protein L19e [Clonorchis sinensis]
MKAFPLFLATAVFFIQLPPTFKKREPLDSYLLSYIVPTLSPSDSIRLCFTASVGLDAPHLWPSRLGNECKGNQFRNKRVLIEHIHKKKAERLRAKQLSDQAEAMRQRKRDARLRRDKRKEDRRKFLIEQATTATAATIAAKTASPAPVAKPAPVAEVKPKAEPKVSEPVKPVQPVEPKPEPKAPVPKAPKEPASSKVAPPPKIPASSKTPAPPPKVPPPSAAKPGAAKKTAKR